MSSIGLETICPSGLIEEVTLGSVCSLGDTITSHTTGPSRLRTILTTSRTSAMSFSLNGTSSWAANSGSFMEKLSYSAVCCP
ncbi:MAG: hypothetical protein NTZ34_12785 [Chloroflexi bacterium]|nr:hypothetical protein [Chloroflexota bacterium]